MLKNNEVPPNQENKEENEGILDTYQPLDEGVERWPLVTEVDPYLAKERQKEEDKRENTFEAERKTKQTKHEDAVERLSIQAKDLAEQNELGSKADASPSPNRVIWEKKSPEKTQKKHKLLSGLFKKGFVLSLAALFAGKAAEAKSAEDTLTKKAPAEKVTSINPGDSLRVEKKKSFDIYQYEKFGISRADLLETDDTTKQVMLVSIPEYRSYGDVFRVLNSAGLTPASKETMDKACEKNTALFKNIGVVSLKQTVNKLGNESYSTINWDPIKNTFRGESREISPLKEGEEKNKKSKKKKGEPENTYTENSSFDSDYEKYRFIVEIPISSDAHYESGLVKK